MCFKHVYLNDILTEISKNHSMYYITFALILVGLAIFTNQILYYLLDNTFIRFGSKLYL